MQMSDAFREVLCRKWALDILQLLNEEGTQNYSGIKDEFDTSSDIIVERLRQLANAGLINRDKRSARDVRYSITDKGEEVLDLAGDIHRLLDE